MSLAEFWPEAISVDALQHVSVSAGSARRDWETSSAALAVVPREAVTDEALSYKKTREALVALVYCFEIYGLSWKGEEAAKINPRTAVAAEMILRALPASKALPRIAPDGEGGLMMVWEGRGEPFLLTIDNFRLHGVIAAATPQAEYIDDMPFDERQIIPRPILDAIPAR
jgi:hypothetical protein